MSSVLCDMDFQAFTYIAPISASAANFITTLIILEMFNTSPFVLGVYSLSDEKKCHPNRLLALVSLRFDALL